MTVFPHSRHLPPKHVYCILSACSKTQVNYYIQKLLYTIAFPTFSAILSGSDVFVLLDSPNGNAALFTEVKFAALDGNMANVAVLSRSGCSNKSALF